MSLQTRPDVNYMEKESHFRLYLLDMSFIID